MVFMSERMVKLIVEYDGSDFSGWQVQPNKRTVQEEIETAIAKITRQSTRITAAGRTDAGVHATGQVANFRTSTTIETKRLMLALNGNLPRDVSIVAIEDVPREFHARFDATARTYRYKIADHRVSIGRNYAWHVKYGLSHELLERAVEPLHGLLNLKGLSRGDEDDDYETVIFKNSWTFEENFMIFEISAIRFFHNAVRRIVGTAVEIARGAVDENLMEQILETGDRTISGPAAPARGLCLVHVAYGENK